MSSNWDRNLQDFKLLVNSRAQPRAAEYNAGLQSIVSLREHTAAHSEISSWPGYATTPLVELCSLARDCEIAALWYKDESSRFGLGSFKPLGSGYGVVRVLQRRLESRIGRRPSFRELNGGGYRELTRALTVTTATDGNHGRSVAWAAQMFGCECVVYIPSTCSAYREMAIARYGADVVRTPWNYDDTVRQCAQEAIARDMIIVSGTSWQGSTSAETVRDIMQGYTLLVEEVLNQLNGCVPTHVFIQAGVGGLAAATCAHLWERLGDSRPLIIVVEPDGAACLFASAELGRVTAVQAPIKTVMAGLECGEPSYLAFEILSPGATAFMTISDEVVPFCMRLLAEQEPPIVAGESAVAGLGGLLCASSDHRTRTSLALDNTSRVLVIGTEGNTDPLIYHSLVHPRTG